MSRPFKSELVIDEKISDRYLRAYYIGFDEKKFRLQPLVDVIRRVIPEFSLGYHCGENIPLNDIVDRLKDAAEAVYLTDKYQKRGEFGELILHLLLRDFQNTIPLISKMYFKDSHNVPAHGFDGVQITINDSEKKLWLGESKLYKTGKAGIDDLAEDIKKHVNADYIRREFSLISKKLPQSIPEIEHWRSLMDKHQKLDIIFSSIVIPMVCTYNSHIYKNHCENTKECLEDFFAECKNLHSMFERLKGDVKTEIILMLLPVNDKDDLNTELDKRLKRMQGI
jgi:hypothetical protein